MPWVFQRAGRTIAFIPMHTEAESEKLEALCHGRNLRLFRRQRQSGCLDQVGGRLLSTETQCDRGCAKGVLRHTPPNNLPIVIEMDKRILTSLLPFRIGCPILAADRLAEKLFSSSRTSLKE